MAFFFKGTSYRVKTPDSLSEQFSLDMAKGMLRVWTGWVSRRLALLDFVGWSEVRETADVPPIRYFHRDAPYPHPDYPNHLYCDSCNFEDDKVPRQPVSQGQQVLHKEALATLGFFAPKYSILTDLETIDMGGRVMPGLVFPDESLLLRYISVKFEPKGFYQSLPGMRALLWNVPPIPPNTDPPPLSSTYNVPLVYAEIHITHHQIPVAGYPHTAIISCMGKTNAGTLGSDIGPLGPYGGPYLAGTLIYHGPSVTEPYRMVTGSFAVDITHKFEYRPNVGVVVADNGTVPDDADHRNVVLGVNSFFRWDPQTHQPVGYVRTSRDGESYIDTSNGLVQGNVDQLLFQPANFNMLFRPEQAS